MLPQAMPGQLLLLLQRWSEPATILTPILPSPYLPVPASMCASFLFTFSTVSLLVCSFTCPNSPNYLGASNLIIHLGVLNSDPELIEVLFFFKQPLLPNTTPPSGTTPFLSKHTRTLFLKPTHILSNLFILPLPLIYLTDVSPRIE